MTETTEEPTRYVTPKGVSENLVEKLDDETDIRNWNGFKIVFGQGKEAFFFREIAERRNSNRSNMIVITGAPGEGKSYFALRLGEIFDKKFKVQTQVVFDRLHLLKLLSDGSSLKRGQVIIIDEAQFVAGSRRWYEEIQKDIMEHLEAVRSKGYIIIIVALHLNLLDVIVRKYILTYMIFLEKRGTGIVYRLYTPRFETEMYRSRLGKVSLALPDAEKCLSPDCLICKHQHTCMTDRSIYESLKREFLSSKATESIKEIEKKSVAKINNEDILKQLMDTYKDKITFTSRGTLYPESIQANVETYLNIHLPLKRCIEIQKLYAILYKKV